MPDIDAIIAKRKQHRRVVDVVICLDPEIADQIHEARAAVTTAKNADSAQATDAPALASGSGNTEEAAIAALAKLTDKAEKAELLVMFQFGGLGSREFNRLRREHPPTEEQMDDPLIRQLGRRRSTMLQWDPEEFPPALLSACATEPPMTVEQAKGLSDVLDGREWQALVESALSACEGRTPVGELGKG